MGVARLLPWLACWGVAATSCGGRNPWRPVEALDRAQQTQQEQAAGARDAVAGQLKKALQSAMSNGGPGAAVTVCRTVAPELTEKVGELRGVRIGRTSHMLRNPKNSAPVWAERVVAGGVSANPQDGPRFFSHPDGRLGALYPIALEPGCVSCHGPAESLGSEVREALAQSYGDDQATGFAVGDLRGWFWVEVPGQGQ